jgi:hypothetical protein
MSASAGCGHSLILAPPSIDADFVWRDASCHAGVPAAKTSLLWGPGTGVSAQAEFSLERDLLRAIALRSMTPDVEPSLWEILFPSAINRGELFLRCAG